MSNRLISKKGRREKPKEKKQKVKKESRAQAKSKLKDRAAKAIEVQDVLEKLDALDDGDKIEVNIDPSKLSKKEQKRLKKEQKKKEKEEKKREKREARKHGIGRKILYGFLIILAILIGIFIIKLAKNNWDFGKTFTNDVLGPKDPIFILAMGVSEDLDTPLTDSMMVLGYNPNEQKAFALSIPRDTFVGNSKEFASGGDKLNSLYRSSPEKTQKAIEKITGLEIDYYVVVQNKVVRDAVDALGAVEFNVPIDMDYDDPTQDLHIHLKQGIQSMNGEQVEQLLRFRHNNDGTSYPVSYGDNDIGRMRTQREFVKELLKQCLRFRNVNKIIDLTTAFFDNVETDMGLSTAVSYVPYALQFEPDNLLSEQVPGQPAMFNEISFIEYFPKDTKKLVYELLEEIGLEEKAAEYAEENNVKTGKKTTNTIENTTNTTNKISNESNNSKTSNSVENKVKNETKNETKNEAKNTTKNTIKNETKNTTKNEVSNKVDNTSKKENTTNKVSIKDTVKKDD